MSLTNNQVKARSWVNKKWIADREPATIEKNHNLINDKIVAG
jgi:hypothetical protein